MKIDYFEEKYSVLSYPLFLGNVSKDFTVDKIFLLIIVLLVLVVL